MAVEEDFEHESLANFVEGLRTGKVKINKYNDKNEMF